MIKSKTGNLQAKSIILVLVLLSITLGIQAQRGSLDVSFGNNGKVTTDFGSSFNDWGYGGAIQSDGKILQVGEIVVSGSNSAFGIARYNSNGTLDTTFGSGGKALADISVNFDIARAAAVQADGKIVVAGVSNYVSSTADVNRSVVRFNANGTIDTTFGTNGRTSFGIGRPQLDTDLAIQSNGDIIVVGTSKFTQSANPVNTYNVAKLNGGGGLVTSFGTNGQIYTTFAGETNVVIYTVVIQPDDKIVVAGSSEDPNSGRITMARYNADGTLDATFDGDGKVATVIGVNAYALAAALQPDGKIVLAGGAFVNGNYLFAAARYNSNGSLDNSFDGDGIATTDIAAFEVATGVVVRNGKITATGYTTGVTNGAFAVVQYNGDGTLDTAFGAGGKVITDFSNTSDYSFDSAIQPDGKLVVFGRTSLQAIDFALARYNLVGASRNNFDFDGDGKADIGVARPDILGLNWYLNRSTLGLIGIQFGLPSDRPAPADYDGDGRTDVAVYRNGIWYLLQSRDGFKAVSFGLSSDALVPGDYDGDGKADIAVVRAELLVGLTWYIQQSSNGQFRSIQFGAPGDKLVPADYDGDSKTDAAVFRSGTWYVQRSSRGFAAVQFGLATDTPIVGDFNANGTADYAVFRNGLWYVLEGENQIDFLAIAYGQQNDVPVAADYDGDGKTDAAVFRNGIWYLNRSTAGFTSLAFGAVGDKPLSNIFVP